MAGLADILSNLSRNVTGAVSGGVNAFHNQRRDRSLADEIMKRGGGTAAPLAEATNPVFRDDPEPVSQFMPPPETEQALYDANVTPGYGMNLLQGASIPGSAVPVVGDLLGLAGDVQMYAESPESRNLTNYLLTAAGMVPIVPTLAGARFLRQGDVDLTARKLLESEAVPPGGSKLEHVAKKFQEESIEMLGGAPMALETAEEISRLARLAAEEADIAIKAGGDLSGWYRSKLAETHRLVGIAHPEIIKNEGAKTAFNYIMAVTSNGMGVPLNSQLALKVYREFKRTGEMPNVGWGDRTNIMKDHFETYNQGVRAYGQEDWHKFLNTDWDKSQLRAMGFDITGSGKAKGSAIIGPKIGGGFFQNLEGNLNPVTLDLWMRRQYGRHTGTVMTVNPELTATRINRFLAAMRTSAGKARMEEMLGEPFVMPNNDQALADLATKIFNRWGQKHGHEALEKGVPPGASAVALQFARSADEAMRAARELHKITNAPVGGWTGKERRVQEAALQEATLLMQAEGIDITPADLQAILWGHEQNVFGHAGVRLNGAAEGSATNFSAEMEKILRDEGISQRRLTNAKRAAETDTRTGREALGFTEGERRNFATNQLSGDLREQIAASVTGGPGVDGHGVYTRGGGKAGRYVLADGTEATIPKKEVLGVDKLPQGARNKFAAFGFGAPPMQELVVNPNTTKIFRDRARAAQISQRDNGLSMTVYATAEEYEGAKLWMSHNGQVGFAINNGDDITSVFNTASDAGGEFRNVIPTIIPLAIEKGGRRLDAFDIRHKVTGESGLPRLYGRTGMVPVARIKFDPNFPPPDVTVAQWAAWGERNGNPDVVFMRYDPKSANTFKMDDVPYVADYDMGVAAQQKTLKRGGAGNRLLNTIVP